MAYQINLSAPELRDLAWATDRGYFPARLYDHLSKSWKEYLLFLDDSGLDLLSRDVLPAQTLAIPENIAWDLIEAREKDSCALFCCIGGTLLEKLVELEDSIV